MKWNTIALGDIAVQRGGSVDPKKYPDEVFELFSIPAFDAGNADIISGSKIGSSKKCVQSNDVMISRIVPHIRRAWVVGDSVGHRQIASGEWIVFRSNDIWPNYLRWVLVGDVFHSAFMQTVSGVGGSLLRARPAEVYKIKIPLPPLEEQKRIAGILDAADRLRAQRRETLAQLDTLLQSTFLELFGDPVTNPKGWGLSNLGSICGNSFRNGLSPSSKGSFSGEVLTLTAITSGTFDGIFRKSALFDREPSVKQRVTRETFLICRGNGNKKLVGVGVFPDQDHLEVTFPDTMIAVDLNKEKITAQYLQAVWANDIVRHQIESGARTTNGTYKVNQSLLSKISFPVPPLDLQRRFAAIVESVEKQKARQRAHLAELDALFASLQSRAFNGEL